MIYTIVNIPVFFSTEFEDDQLEGEMHSVSRVITETLPSR